MCRLTIFGVIAAMVYVLGVIENAGYMTQSYERGLAVFAESGPTRAPVKGLGYVILAMGTVLASRLYLQAWAVDEMRSFRRARRKTSTGRRVLDYVLRLVWVGGVVWLPQAYAVAAGAAFDQTASMHLYLFVLMASVFAWDLTMRPMIFGYTKRDRKDLVRNWLALDAVMTTTLGLAWLSLAFVPTSPLGNWGIGVALVSIQTAFVVSLVQLVMWAKQILQSLRSGYPRAADGAAQRLVHEE
ncbi:MAG: hypothetical protein JW889_03375 [Verrucomicrobia bacterium]|nr:hypothetical protein [Verrucomicrobiota bacterium]